MLGMKDAKKVIESLQSKPFICSVNEITTDNGYVILTKKRYEEMQLMTHFITRVISR